MSVIFQLVVNFGADLAAADAAAEAVREQASVSARGVALPLEEEHNRQFWPPGGYIEVIVGAGIDHHHTLPGPDLKPLPLSSSEITSVGHQFYDLLRRFSGYQAAIVGWNRDDVVEFSGDLFPPPRLGPVDLEDVPGLVLAADLCDRWGFRDGWVPFTEGFRWIPYEGDPGH